MFPGRVTWFWLVCLPGDGVRVQDRFEFSLEQMRELAANAVEASFLPPERKLELLQQVERYGF
jgi:aminodeoxyfutalosine deaminase